MTIRPHTPLFDLEPGAAGGDPPAGDPAPASGALGAGVVEPGVGGTPPVPGSGVDYTSEAAYSQFVATLPEAQKNLPVFQTTKTLGSLAEQLVNSQSALGKKRLVAPEEGWTPEQYQEFYAQTGRPETSDAYAMPEEFVMGEGLDAPEFSDATIKDLQEFAHNSGLNPQQYENLANKLANYEATRAQAEAQAVDEAVAGYKTQLMQMWGQDLNQNMTMANEAFAALSQEIPALNEILKWPMVQNHPAILQVFHKMATVMGDSVPGMAGSPGAFGNKATTLTGLKQELETFEQDNHDVIYSDTSSMTIADREAREKILEKRLKLIQSIQKAGDTSSTT